MGRGGGGAPNDLLQYSLVIRGLTEKALSFDFKSGFKTGKINW